jgi:hypothetical protein
MSLSFPEALTFVACLLELFIPFPLIFGGESYVMGLVQTSDMSGFNRNY